jgi:nucleoside-diphosphate kinase
VKKAHTEMTLGIVKPDGVNRSLTGEIIKRIEAQGLRVVALKMLQLQKSQAEQFYIVHREKPFFPSLTSYIASGVIVAMVLEGDDAIKRYRELMGATDPQKAIPGTIRSDFGISIEQNTVHGSDSPETAVSEISFFFNRLEIVKR